jgi:release factor glutamine methyltransferase
MEAGEPGTVSWRTLWSETAAIVAGGRPAARWLCETASGCDGAGFIAVLDEPATVRSVAHLDSMLARLANGEPLQYVLGRWGFRRLDLLVDRRVLIPRPETEGLVDVAIEALQRGSTSRNGRPARCLDLGCGSGAIGLALALELPLGTEVWLTDVSVDALDVARANAAGLGRMAGHVNFAHGDWYDALDAGLAGTFDVICANPPYVAADDPGVEDVVRLHEPHLALFATDEGMSAIRTVVHGASVWLRAGGTVVVEIGSTQADAAAATAQDAGLVDVEVRADLAGLPRLLVGRCG